MNKYGARALKHWTTHLPKRYSQIENPNSFFSSLGEQIEQRVDERTEVIAGDDPPNETYLQKMGRLTEARLTAESEALKELALLEVETTSN